MENKSYVIRIPEDERGAIMSIFLFSKLLFLSEIGQVFQGQTFQNDLRVASSFRRRCLANHVQRPMAKTKCSFRS